MLSPEKFCSINNLLRKTKSPSHKEDPSIKPSGTSKSITQRAEKIIDLSPFQPI